MTSLEETAVPGRLAAGVDALAATPADALATMPADAPIDVSIDVSATAVLPTDPLPTDAEADVLVVLSSLVASTPPFCALLSDDFLSDFDFAFRFGLRCGLLVLRIRAGPGLLSVRLLEGCMSTGSSSTRTGFACEVNCIDDDG